MFSFLLIVPKRPISFISASLSLQCVYFTIEQTKYTNDKIWYQTERHTHTYTYTRMRVCTCYRLFTLPTKSNCVAIENKTSLREICVVSIRCLFFHGWEECLYRTKWMHQLHMYIYLACSWCGWIKFDDALSSVSHAHDNNGYINNYFDSKISNKRQHEHNAICLKEMEPMECRHVITTAIDSIYIYIFVRHLIITIHAARL